MASYTPTDFIQTGTAATGGRMTTYCAMDTDKNYDVILLQNHLSTLAQELIPLV